MSKLTPVINHIEDYCEEIFTQAVELSKIEENFRNTLYIYLTVQEVTIQKIAKT